MKVRVHFRAENLVYMCEQVDFYQAKIIAFYT